jgi:hypothetical protein
MSRPGEVREVRALDHVPASGYGQPSTASGYFTDPDALVRELQGMGGASGVYVTQNPVDPDLLARSNNRLKRKARHTTADGDVARYAHLTVDCDPARKAGISATDAELARALARRDAVATFLTAELGWPAPVVELASGNGGHATWRIDLAADEDGRALVESALQTLAALFGADDVSIDTTLANPSRIVKLAGTVAGKGDSLPHRPHRVAHGTFAPDAGVVSEAQLRALVALMPEGKPDSPSGRTVRAGGGNGASYDVPGLLRAAGIVFTEHTRGEFTAYRLDCCLTSDAHNDGAAILQFVEGAVAYRCHHNSCAGKGWQDVKARLGLPEGSARTSDRTQVAGASAGPGATGAARLVIRTLSDVQPQAIGWLWRGWLARGKFHLFAGHPGDGKSSLAAEIAAIGSGAGLWPDNTPAPEFRTLFVLGEDSLADTLRPRLDCFGADATRVHAIETVLDEHGQERFFDVARHLDLLEAAIAEHRIDHLVIDPLSTSLAGSDRNAEGDMRDRLTPLVKLAERANVAVTGIAHTGKPTGTSRTPMQRILGSTGLVALARLIWMTAGDGDDRMAVGVVKSNLAMKPAPLAWSRVQDGPIEWHGEASQGIEDLLSAMAPVTARADAEGWLRDSLAAGPLASEAVKAGAKAAGIAWATLRRAADEVAVVKFKATGAVNGPWLWRLPDTPESKLLTPQDTHVSNLSNFAASNLLNTVAREQVHATTPIAFNGKGKSETHIMEGAQLAHVGVLRGEQVRSVADLPPLTDRAAEMLERLMAAPPADLAELNSYRAELAAVPDDDPTIADERLALAHFDASMAARGMHDAIAQGQRA